MRCGDSSSFEISEIKQMILIIDLSKKKKTMYNVDLPKHFFTLRRILDNVRSNKSNSTKENNERGSYVSSWFWCLYTCFVHYRIYEL